MFSAALGPIFQFCSACRWRATDAYRCLGQRKGEQTTLRQTCLGCFSLGVSVWAPAHMPPEWCALQLGGRWLHLTCDVFSCFRTHFPILQCLQMARHRRLPLPGTEKRGADHTATNMPWMFFAGCQRLGTRPHAARVVCTATWRKMVASDL